jgi:lantibiotic modifying enzyme
MDLYSTDRHVPLINIPWDAHRLENNSQYIIAQTLANYSPISYWPVHPLDSEEASDQGFNDFYYGAAGIFWFLNTLKLKNEFKEFMKGLSVDKTSNISFFFDHIAFLLFKEKLDPSKENRDELYQLFCHSPDGDKNEILYGTPSTLLAAYQAYKLTGEQRFADCCQTFKQRTLAQWKYFEKHDCYMWTQHFDQPREYVGAAHGTFGNIHVLYTIKELLNETELSLLNIRSTQAFKNLATVSHEYANWPALAEPADKLLLHWCHGAPGAICALADHLPSTPETDELFLKAAELIWKAGPLNKGTSLCHGTSGNALAFLKIYKRSSDDKWLVRAKAFAMHCLEQCEELEKSYGQLRYSLWTGDLGLVWLNEQIKKNEAKLPLLDIY